MPARKTGSQRRLPRQQRARLTVDAVLDATVLILKRDGFSQITTNRIAEVAGISIGSLYQYFPDKGAIFVALHQRHVEEVDRLIERTFRLHAGSSLEVLLRSFIAPMVDLHATDTEVHEMLMAQVPHRAAGATDLPTRIHGALRSALSSRAPDVEGPDNLDGVAFVTAHMIDSLSHGAALRRPASVSLADAKMEALQAVLAYLGQECSGRSAPATHC